MKQIFLVVALSTALASASAAQEVRLATDDSNPPYSSIDDDGELAGFDWELGELLCEHLELDCIWETRRRGTLLHGLLVEDYDAVIAAMPSEADYAEGLSLTQPYVYPDIFSFVGRAGTELPFGAGTVAILPGRDLSAFEAETGRDFLAYETLETAIEAVLDGTVDAILAPKTLLAPAVDASEGALGYVYRDQKLSGGLAIVFRAADADLRTRFEDAIFDLAEDGALGALAEEWFGVGAAVR